MSKKKKRNKDKKISRNDPCPCGCGKKSKNCQKDNKEERLKDPNQPRAYPISDIIIGFSKHGQIRGVTELYLPSIFSQLVCVVENFSVELKNMRHMTLRTRFRIEGDVDLSIDNCYKGENWKLMATNNFFRTKPLKYKEFKKPLPFLTLMLNQTLQVVSAKMKDEQKEVLVAFDQSPDLVALPPSHPPLTDLPDGAQYNYYDKKSTVLYGDLELNRAYDIEIKLESCGASFEFAPLFPFGKVIFDKINLIDDSDLEIEPALNEVLPESKDVFPDWVEYKLKELENHDPSNPMPPLNRPASPFRGNLPVFDINKDTVLSGITRGSDIPDNFLINIDDVNGLELVDYKALRFSFVFVIPEDKDYDIMVRSIDHPLPTRIYEQIQKLPSYQDVLIEYDIINMGNEELNLKIETEISDYSNRSIDEIKIAPAGNGEGKKARIYFKHCPRLKRGVLEKIDNPEKTSIYSKITNLNTDKVIYENTTDLTLLPKDQMIWELRDLRSNSYYNLRDFVCAWVKPNDAEGLIDKVRTEASRLLKNGAFGSFANGRPTVEEVEEHFRAIYEYLSKEEFNYVNRAFTSLMVEDSQRIINPETVIKDKSGNCIDFTILFASILEGLGIYSLICIMPGHAFIAWGDCKDSDNMFFLETTTIGRKTFEEAKVIAKNNFVKHFIMTGAGSRIMNNDITFEVKKSYIVKLEEAREDGIIAMGN